MRNSGISHPGRKFSSTLPKKGEFTHNKILSLYFDVVNIHPTILVNIPRLYLVNFVRLLTTVYAPHPIYRRIHCAFIFGRKPLCLYFWAQALRVPLWAQTIASLSLGASLACSSLGANHCVSIPGRKPCAFIFGRKPLCLYLWAQALRPYVYPIVQAYGVYPPPPSYGRTVYAPHPIYRRIHCAFIFGRKPLCLYLWAQALRPYTYRAPYLPGIAVKYVSSWAPPLLSPPTHGTISTICTVIFFGMGY